MPRICGKHHEEENKFASVNMLIDFDVLYRTTDYVFTVRICLSSGTKVMTSIIKSL